MLLLVASIYVSERYTTNQQQLAAAGNTEEAVGAANTAARYDPFSPEPLQARASLLQSQGKNQLAEDVLQQAIGRDPNNFVLYLSLGNLQMSMGKFEAAEESFREVLRLNPMASAATSGIAQSLIRRGKLEEAKAEYEKLYEDKDIDTLGTYDLGRIYVRTGEPERGFKLINQATRRAEKELEGLDEGALKTRQEDLIESMKLAAADALVVRGEYNRAYNLVEQSSSDQAPALLELISTDPEGYRESVINSDIY